MQNLFVKSSLRKLFFPLHYMRNIFFILLFMTSYPALAQLKVNAFWTTNSNMPAKDVIYYKNRQPLQWADFQGQPVMAGNIAAITMSGFGYGASIKYSGDKGELNVSVYCYFNKPKSWVKPGKTTDYILEHEQRHFDISYLSAALFMETIKNREITIANYNEVLPKIYKDCSELMHQMQDEYDSKTANGQITSKQEEWNKVLKAKLADL